MEYLLEEYLFSDEDIHLNAETLLWPRNIGPVFDSNDEVMKIETGGKKPIECDDCRLFNKFEARMNKFSWNDANV